MHYFIFCSLEQKSNEYFLSFIIEHRIQGQTYIIKKNVFPKKKPRQTQHKQGNY